MRSHAATFGAGAAGGAAASALGVPLPWLIGAIVATAALRAARPAPAPPVRARKLGQLVLGATVALNLTPAALASLGALAPLMVVAALLSIGAAAGIAVALSRLSPVDRRTAFFACMPGGVAEMSALAEHYGARAPLVALAQSLRIVTVVVSVPIAMHLLAGAAPQSLTSAAPLGADKIAPLLGLSFILALCFDRWGVFNSWFLASITVAGGLAASEAVAGSMPAPLSAFGQILVGSALGARLDAALIRDAGRIAPRFVAATAALILANAALAAVLAAAAPLDLRSLALATAPGGIAEMSITAQELGAAVPAVAAFHFIRILLIVALTAPLYQRIFAPVWVDGRS